jgi:hypothetical protein
VLLKHPSFPEIAYVRPALRRRVFAFLSAASPNNCGIQRGRINRRASGQLAEIFVIRRESLTDAPE